MEPMIYNPGAYKTPGVYKGTGGIYNGLGVYNGGEKKEKTIVLTFFEYTPIGDELLQFSYDSYHSPDSLMIDGENVPGILVHDTPGNVNAGNNLDISNYSKVSVKFYFRINQLYANEFVQNYGVCRFIRFFYNGSNLLVQIDENPGEPLSTIYKCSLYDILEFICVYDRNDGKEKIYINGVFVYKINVPINVTTAKIRSLAKSSQGSFKITAWQLYNGDLSEQ